MSEALEARIIRIQFETGRTGRIYATSPDIKGLMVGRRTMEELEAVLPQAISDMYAACGEGVVVSRVARDREENSESWVAFPADVARRALAGEASGLRNS